MHYTHLAHSTAPPLWSLSRLPINLVLEELFKDVANQWSCGSLGKNKAGFFSYTSPKTPLPLPPLHPEVTHTIVCFGFFGLASRATLLAARLQQRTPRTVNMSVSHHDTQGDTPFIYTCRPLPKSDPSQLDESPHGRCHQHQVLI